MKRTIFTVAAALLIAAPAVAQKVNIDYASDFDFEGVETFQYVETEDSSIKDNPMMADRVVGMIKSELTEGGLREVDGDPDLFVTYHFLSEERKQLSTTSMGMGGYGGYWGGWDAWGPYDAWGGPMMGSSVTREYSYEEGTLVIDAYDSKEKKMVWRGMGTVTVKAKPEKQVKQVEKILTKLGKRWDKILAGMDK